MSSKAIKPDVKNRIYFCLNKASIPGVITVETHIQHTHTDRPGGVVMNNFCRSSFRLLPVLLLSVWVCLCMRHSLLNPEEHRYSKRTSKRMTQTSMFDFHHYVSLEGEEVFNRQPHQTLMCRRVKEQQISQSLPKHTSHHSCTCM